VSDQSEILKARARRFALDVIAFVNVLPDTAAGRYVAGQLLRAANAVAANYRAACRARSLAEFVAKMGTVAEEADESTHWLDISGASGMATGPTQKRLHVESGELEAIFSASYGTSKRNLNRKRGKPPE
jgi:four helix bundle protein